MTREEADFIGGMNMCDKISNEAYKKIMCHCEVQEPCDDAISRQAAIDAMYALCDTGETLKENPWRDNPHIDAITDALDNLPPVTPTRKKGHWIDDKCFVCGKGIEDLIDSREWYRNEETKFCPFCGIKLVEPQKSEVRDADSN